MGTPKSQIFLEQLNEKFQKTRRKDLLQLKVQTRDDNKTGRRGQDVDQQEQLSPRATAGAPELCGKEALQAAAKTQGRDI